MHNYIFKLAVTSLLIFSLSSYVNAQMDFQGESLFGNEWIDFTKTYKKFTLNEDGIYRITYQELVAAGLPSDMKGREVQIYSHGKLVPLYLTKAGDFGPGDFIEFYGERNKGELDEPLYRNSAAQQLNPEYSMFSDFRPYYLTWEDDATTNPRIDQLDTDLSGDLPNPETFYMAQNHKMFSGNYIFPLIDTEDVRFSSFWVTEGFGSSFVTSNELEFDVPNFMTSEIPSILSFRLAQNSPTHILRVEFNGDLIENESSNGYQVKDYTYEILNEDINNNNVVTINGVASNSDRNTVAYATLEYPSELNANNQSTFYFEMDRYSFDKYLEFENFNAQGNEVFVIDVNNNQRVSADASGGNVRFLLEAPEEDRHLYIYSQPKQISQVTDVNFVNYEELSPEFVILTSKDLDIADADGENWIQNYRELKSSELGGGYITEVVHYADIKEQFGYGIDGHPLAINNWANYMKTKWEDWEFAFIIGKAHEYGTLRQQPNLLNHVPTFGQPGSDNLLFAANDTPFPVVALGRVAAQTVDEVRGYYKKSVNFEQVKNSAVQTIEDKHWMKEIIHLSGGDAFNQGIISDYLDQMAAVIIPSKFGADVHKYSKTTSDPIQTSVSAGIINDIDDGAAIITFFGHSAVGTFDFSLEDPEKLNNFDNLPLIVSLGCHSGNIHTKNLGISENFVLFEDAGSIAFYASSGTAFINEQFLQGLDIYDFLGDDFNTLPIGISTRESLEINFVDSAGVPLTPEKYYVNEFYRIVTLLEQLTFHGDPSLVIYPHEGPDYTPDFTSFRTEPEVITSNLQEFELEFEIANLGSFEEDSLDIVIIHSYGSRSDSLSISIPTPANSTLVKQTLPLNSLEAIGENVIEVIVDINEKITELPAPTAENNNSLRTSYQIEGYSFFVISDNPIPYHPHEFSITNNQDLTLRASTGNSFVGPNTYTIQLDTTELFNSSLLIESSIPADGGLIDWNPDITFVDNTVYYWRVQATNSQAGQDIWNTSSFIFMNEFENGWNQSHLYQYLKDDFATMQVDSAGTDFEYVSDLNEVKLLNPLRITSTDHLEFSINESRLGAVFNVDSLGMVFLVLDPNTLEPIRCPGNGQFGVDTRSSLSDGQEFWVFRADNETERAEIRDFLVDVVPTGYFVFAAYTNTPGDFSAFEDWEESLISVFEDQGSTLIRDLIENPRAYWFVYEKDEGAVKEEIVALQDPLPMSTIVQLEGTWFEGTTFSTLIGPAQKWEKLIWNVTNVDPAEDEFRISLFGINANEVEDTLVFNVQNEEFDLSAVNANTYPYLRLEFYSTDLVTNTSPDLDFWRVVYDPVPESIISKGDNYAFISDTLPRGETLQLNYEIKNITDLTMDSILVKYSFIDQENNEISETQRYAQLSGNGDLQIEYSRQTAGLSGLYEFRIEVNPDDDQPEQFHFNNLGFLRFLVDGDDLNPVLDVTFDGVRIMDGDIVAPRPVIKVTLTDDNAFLVNDNPENFEIVLEDQFGNFELVDITSDQINFIAPANEGDPTCIEYTPVLEEGEYTLFVQGKDASGNFSGDQPYTVTFRIVLEDAISNVLTYPNPFSDRTQFIFTMTGSEVPENYHIKIMTLSGKVVKEIREEELGPIHIGVNRTDYRWDGRDDFGSKLGNGVYLYKLYTDKDNDFEDLEQGDISKHFKKGFGKLVILR